MSNFLQTIHQIVLIDPIKAEKELVNFSDNHGDIALAEIVENMDIDDIQAIEVSFDLTNHSIISTFLSSKQILEVFKKYVHNLRSMDYFEDMIKHISEMLIYYFFIENGKNQNEIINTFVKDDFGILLLLIPIILCDGVDSGEDEVDDDEFDEEIELIGAEHKGFFYEKSSVYNDESVLCFDRQSMSEIFDIIAQSEQYELINSYHNPFSRSRDKVLKKNLQNLKDLVTTNKNVVSEIEEMFVTI